MARITITLTDEEHEAFLKEIATLVLEQNVHFSLTQYMKYCTKLVLQQNADNRTMLEEMSKQTTSN